MEDVKVKIIAESYVENAKVDLGEILTIVKGLVEATNQLNLANKRTSDEAVKGNKEQIGLINEINTKIQNLTRLRNEADSVSKIESYNSKIREQQGELTKLTTAQARSNVLTKEQSDKLDILTNTTKKTSSAFSNMAITLGAFFAVDRFIDMAKGAFNLAITTDSLDVALKNVSASTKEYNQSIAFLNDITNRYGQQLVNLEGQYTQFIASSKSSNLTLIERNKIFESVIAAGSSLKLSNDKIEASLRAVSQMFSKGNVSAEELRQQLGEALPGAFGIFAQAMGVSETQLNKLLEQGKVAAADVLPKVANELNNLYGATAQNNVNTWTGASNRAYNAMTAWIVKQNESLGLSDKLAKMANYVADNFDKIVNVVKSAIITYSAYNAVKIASNTVDKVKLINIGLEIIAKKSASVATIELTEAEIAAEVAAKRFNATLASAPWGIAMVAGTLFVKMLLDAKDAQDRLFETTEAGIKQTDSAIKEEVKHGIAIGNTIEQTKKLAYGTDERIKAVEGLMKQYPQYFKELNAEQVSNWHLTNAYRMVNAEIQTKITLLAREKSIQKTTDRLTDIKLELEAMGVYVNTLREFNAQEKERGLHINLNGPKIHALLKEQDKLTTNLIKSEGQLSNAQINQMNVELRANKAKYESKLITLNQFKEEANRIQETYGRYVKIYELNTTEPPKITTTQGKELKKQVDQIAESNKDIEKLKQQSLDKIKKIDDDYAKELFKSYEERAKIITKAVEQIQSNFNQVQADGQKEHNQVVTDSINSLGKRITDFYNENVEKTEEESKARILLENRTLGQLKMLRNAFRDKERLAQEMFGKELIQLSAEEIKQLVKSIKENTELLQKFITATLDALGNQLDNLSNKINDKLKSSGSLAEKEALVVGGKITDAFSSNVKGASALMKGDLVGAAQGLFGYYKAIWDVTIGFNKTLDKIKREDFLQKFADTFNSLASQSDQIKTAFDGLVNSAATLNNTTLTGAELVIKTQIDAANKIKEKYNLSVSEENDYHTKVINNIQAQLAREIEAINQKYDYLNLKANLRFTADSLAIRELMNQELLGYITNEESKTTVNAEYLAKRKFIYDTYASQIKPITDDMSEAEVAGINAAIKARDEQLARVEDWLTTELEFIFSSEDQKRKVYSETDLIIQKGKEDLNNLSIKYTAEELERNTSKNTELQTAEANKNLSLEVENKRYNEALVLLATEKDAAIADSFNKLKDVITNGYAEMQAAAKKAYDDGLITAAEFEAAMQRIIYLKSLIDGSKSDVEIRVGEKLKDKGINLPGFHNGTEFVQGEKGYDKILAKIEYGEGVINAPLNAKKIKAGLTNESAINYAINYKSLLQDMPNLTIKSSIAGKIEERNAMQYLLNMNVNPLVDEMREVKNVISKLPIQTFNLDENGLTRYEQKGNAITIFKSKRLK